MTAPPAASAVVLLVEDETLVRMFAADALREVGGFEVIEATHADEALTVLQARRIGVVVTDVEMPGALDGFALARRVAQAWPWTGLVVATGRAVPADDDLPASACFITKPYPVDTLVGAVRDALARSGAIVTTDESPLVREDAQAG